MYGTLNTKKTDKNRSYYGSQNILYSTHIFQTANNFHFEIPISGRLIADKCHKPILYLVQRLREFYGRLKQIYKFFHKKCSSFFCSSQEAAGGIQFISAHPLFLSGPALMGSLDGWCRHPAFYLCPLTIMIIQHSPCFVNDTLNKFLLSHFVC